MLSLCVHFASLCQPSVTGTVQTSPSRTPRAPFPCAWSQATAGERWRRRGARVETHPASFEPRERSPIALVPCLSVRLNHPERVSHHAKSGVCAPTTGRTPARLLAIRGRRPPKERVGRTFALMPSARAQRGRSRRLPADPGDEGGFAVRARCRGSADHGGFAVRAWAQALTFEFPFRA
jgi:hypothetical protein